MSGIKLDISGISKGLADAELKAKAAMNLYAETASKVFEAYAKSNYSWTNRTYLAGKTLTGSHEWVGNTLRVNIEHGVEYGIYLEFAHGGKNAILWPTINACSSRVLAGLKNMW